MRIRTSLQAFGLGVVLLGLNAPAEAGIMYGADPGTTSSTLFGGDRRLDTMGFVGGASNAFTTANFAQFTDGRMLTVQNGVGQIGPFGWNDGIPRDVTTSQNSYSGNPDRAGNATPFLGEGENPPTGTLSEVFGTERLGYQNMSWIIDGENVSGAGNNPLYVIDLLYGNGKFLTVDDDATTVELAILERGLNSAINVYGILADDGTFAGSTVTGPLLVDFSKGGLAELWQLNTLEIGGSQKVGGYGISLDSSWNGIVGVRLEFTTESAMNGPDIVGVGSAVAVPEPGTATLFGIGLACALGVRAMRRRASRS